MDNSLRTETPSVCVMMSTYNGQRFLREQIDSILNQKDVRVSLWIRDDGSSDDTVKIVEDYMNRADNVFLIKGSNIGLACSFMELIYQTPDTYNYYAFSDQDDIWLEDKLSTGVRMLAGHREKCLYTANQECVDCDGHSLGLRYREDEDIHTSKIAVLEKNMLAGCTFLFTRDLKCLLKEENKRPGTAVLKRRIHDVWVINAAALYDGVIYDSSSHMLYRQHENNAVGAYTGGRLYDLRLKLEKLRDKDQRNGRSLMAAELHRCFPEKTEDLAIYKACDHPQRIQNKIILLGLIPELKKYSGETNLGLAAKIILNLF